MLYTTQWFNKELCFSPDVSTILRWSSSVVIQQYSANRYINTQLKPEVHKLAGSKCLDNQSWDGHVQTVAGG